ncbi:hypothetical protein ASG76_11480 [Nocardioides sp. Soil774]|uniref:hypothetical protein n=1 Tax=Nocardioides sp. Soil774 TaxID=1736408 RepID=UPI0006FE0103|nr:hypothetical protein [Nocardioides sp. Soil774]KRE94022.1 hypothetical protein ASG76_11480 [Nocardioides sp. Soil774]
MAPALLLLVVVVVGGTIAINLFLRNWVREGAQREAHLRDPRTHTVAFAIPNGVDPVTAEAALAHAGFSSGHERVGMVECVRIECDESQRDRVRSVLESALTSEYDRSLLPAGHVVFEDER